MHADPNLDSGGNFLFFWFYNNTTTVSTLLLSLLLRISEQIEYSHAMKIILLHFIQKRTHLLDKKIDLLSPILKPFLTITT